MVLSSFSNQQARSCQPSVIASASAGHLPALTAGVEARDISGAEEPLPFTLFAASTGSVREFKEFAAAAFNSFNHRPDR
jgi:hypothetical protein